MPSPPLPLEEIPTLTLLYKLKHLPPAEETNATPNSKFNDIISLIRHDITALEVSAIVNAANRSLLGGGGVDGAIHARAGPGLYDECEALDGCKTGSAKITGAYELPCEKVIHAVGPVYAVQKRKGSDRPAELLRACYETALQLAVDNGCKSIAFSCISTGVYGYPAAEAAEEVVKLVRAWLEEREKDGFGGIERIVFCCFMSKDEEAYQEFLPLYFPPVEDKKHATDAENQEAADSLEKKLPDPPSTEPTEDGEPETKRRKTTEIEDDWEEIEKSQHSATNGDEPSMSSGKKDREVTGDTAADTIDPNESSGLTQPTHSLLKDW